jgi:hypothetical protein
MNAERTDLLATRSKAKAKKEEELEMPKNTDTSTDSNDEETPLPKKPVKIEKTEEDDIADAEQEIKKAEIN